MTVDGAAGETATIKGGQTLITLHDTAKAEAGRVGSVKGGFDKAVAEAAPTAGYPLVARDNTSVAVASNILDIFTAQKITVILILTCLIILVTMVYGPVAAMPVELFATRIRTCGLSLPYHIGNGWCGGLRPSAAFAILARSGTIYAGLRYGIIVALGTVVVGTNFGPGGTHKGSVFAGDGVKQGRLEPLSLS